MRRVGEHPMAPAAARASRTAVDPQMAQNQLILFSFEFILIPVGGLLAPRRPPRAVTQGNQRAQGGGYPTARPPVPGRPSAAGVNCGGRVIMFPLWFDATSLFSFYSLNSLVSVSLDNGDRESAPTGPRIHT